MLKQITKASAFILVFAAILYAASTAVNLSDTNRTSGVLPVSRAGTGQTSVAERTALAGPIAGAAAAPTFKVMVTGLDLMPYPNDGRIATCSATGTTVSCLGEDSFDWSSLTDSAATATLPAYAKVSSDTTGAACFVTGTDAQWFSGRGLTNEYSGVVEETSGAWFSIGFGNGGALTCNDNDPTAVNRAIFYLDTATSANWQCYTSDGDGVNSQTQDSLVPADTSFHRFKISFAAGPTANFYIDDALVCANTLQVPNDQVLYWGLWAYCDGCGGVARHIGMANFTLYSTPF